LSQRIAAALPEYTDHSVAHMDKLWEVTDQVLLSDEITKLTQSEAFLLASSFYVHDLGMALPVTAEGVEEIRSTEAFRIARARFSKLSPSGGQRVDDLAVREATRELHANKALDIATKQIPGIGMFLIEDTEFRARWGNLVGRVSESHHWSLSEVERLLGGKGSLQALMERRWICPMSHACFE
jgi:hypothetical protein